MAVETWKDVVGYEGRYQVSDLGRVKSLPNKVRHSELVLKPQVAKRGGYLVVNLTDRDPVSLTWRQGLHYVHTLVLTAFKGARPSPESECCHDDGIPANCVSSNLRWDTVSGNQMDRAKHGTSNRGVQNAQVKLTETQAREIKRRIAAGEKDVDIAVGYPVSHYAIKAIRNGYNWSWI